jgi:hypothetical protein
MRWSFHTMKSACVHVCTGECPVIYKRDHCKIAIPVQSVPFKSCITPFLQGKYFSEMQMSCLMTREFELWHPQSILNDAL